MDTPKEGQVLPETPLSGVSEVEATKEPTDVKTNTGAGSKRTVPRTDEDVSALTVLYDGSALAKHYKDRGSKDALVWVKEVTAGLTEKFSAIRAETIEEEQLEAVYDLGMRVCELERQVKQRGIAEVFTLYNHGTLTGAFTKGASLFSKYSTATIEQVRKSVRYVKEYEEEHLVWGMTLTFALMENSCEPELRAKINEELMGIPPMEQGGPTYFVLAIRAISSMSYAVSLSLIVKVNDMRIKDFEGEDVTKAVSFLRGALQRLKMCNQTPPNVVHQLLKIMQTSSNYKFNAFFATWYNTLEQNSVLYGNPLEASVTTDQILTMASRQYLTLNEEGQWIIQRKKGAAFNSRRRNIGAHNTQLNREDTEDIPYWKRPPKKGEPSTRSYRGKPENWCTKCKKWCRHSTDTHVDNWSPPGGDSDSETPKTTTDSKDTSANVSWSDPPTSQNNSPSKGLAGILRRTGN